MKLLILEDDDALRGQLAAALADGPLEVLAAADGYEALEIVDAHAPALLILDWEAPGRPALEICQHVRQRNTRERPYILMVTSRDSTDAVVAAFASGADDCVQAPYELDRLRARIGAAVRLVLRDYGLVLEKVALHAALARMHDLPELLAICSGCRRVRDGDRDWEPLERYFSQQTGVQFSHGICPDCAPHLMEPKRSSSFGTPPWTPRPPVRRDA